MSGPESRHFLFRGQCPPHKPADCPFLYDKGLYTSCDIAQFGGIDHNLCKEGESLIGTAELNFPTLSFFSMAMTLAPKWGFSKGSIFDHILKDLIPYRRFKKVIAYPPGL